MGIHFGENGGSRAKLLHLIDRFHTRNSHSTLDAAPHKSPTCKPLPEGMNDAGSEK